MDSPEAERILRHAFIVAATRAVRATDFKATQSQIASIAGVSRLEVRRTLAQVGKQSAAKPRQSKSRLEALVHGWRSDPLFIDRAGRPRPLAYRGTSSKFDQLVRKYGRDVTQTALRVQLVRRGIAIDKGGQLILQSQIPIHAPVNAASADIKFIASQLANIDFDLGRRAYSTKRVSILANGTKTAQTMRRVASARLETVLRSLETMSEFEHTKSKKNRKASHRLYVTTTVAIESGEPE
jgi:hypothetical protein